MSENKKQSVHSHPHVHLYKHSQLHRREGEVICELCGYSHDGMKIEEKAGVIDVAGVRIVEGDYDALEEQAITEMEMLTQWVERQGGIVGHVKTYLEERGSASSLTLAGGQVQVERTKESRTNVILSAVILNVDVEKLRCRVAEFLGRMII
ncbi:MAG: hypothetical protein HFI89_10330 [Lachnospiraceae bacterium]|jgi:hypothetical protein|nr:hypothetical protein [Lachnospiraceae bacterium]